MAFLGVTGLGFALRLLAGRFMTADSTGSGLRPKPLNACRHTPDCLSSPCAGESLRPACGGLLSRGMVPLMWLLFSFALPWLTRLCLEGCYQLNTDAEPVQRCWH